jgi:uncharacterized phage protein (TIGR02218 family)
MPLRNISAELEDHLSGNVLSLALCVKFTLMDGTLMGFTSHDRNLKITDEDEIETTYEARSSVESSAIRQEASSGVDNVEVTGLIQSDRITEEDIRAGRYDGAAVEFFLVNFRDLAQGRLLLLKGSLGEVGHGDGAFVAEVRSLSQRLAQQIGELTAPTCRVKQLGDERCKVDLTPFRFVRSVTAVVSVYQLKAGVDAHASDYFTYGKIEVTSGANAGLSREIKDHVLVGADAVLTLQEVFPYAFVNGDALVLEAGCDRQPSTCKTKFANLVNIRCEPDIPGTGKVLKRGRR